MEKSLGGVSFTPGQANAIGRMCNRTYDILWAFAGKPNAATILWPVERRSARNPRLCKSESLGQASCARRQNPWCLHSTNFATEHPYSDRCGR